MILQILLKVKAMIKRFVVILSAVVMLSGCEDGLNFFTVEQDIQFGQQMDESIMTSDDYTILKREQYPVAYQHIERIMDKLLTAKDLRYAQTFPWQVRIIKDDNVLNAFAAPGGYMYFYTGLIKYLDNEAQFAGVMAHEMAHADRRHSTQMLTRQYGFSLLLSMALGDNPSQLEQIAAELAMGLGNLKYSRTNEYEADEYGVKYLYSTGYHARELAGFFEKLNEGQTSRTVEFLSTHPSPENRIEQIEAVWQSLGGATGSYNTVEYTQFKNSLP